MACSVFFVYSISSLCEGATMHPLFAQASGLTHYVFGAAIEAHKDMSLRLIVTSNELKRGVSMLILPGANLE
jgi:hypothetical protein